MKPLSTSLSSIYALHIEPRTSKPLAETLFVALIGVLTQESSGRKLLLPDNLLLVRSTSSHLKSVASTLPVPEPPSLSSNVSTSFATHPQNYAQGGLTQHRSSFSASSISFRGTSRITSSLSLQFLLPLQMKPNFDSCPLF